MSNKTVTINFYWDDLTEKKKKEILDIFGENNNWDTFPFCTMEIELDEIERKEE